MDMGHDISWMPDGNCHNKPHLTSLLYAVYAEEIRRAKRICEGCPVASECLKYALDTRQNFGIWGGKSESERRWIRRRSILGVGRQVSQQHTIPHDTEHLASVSPLLPERISCSHSHSPLVLLSLDFREPLDLDLAL